MRSEIHRIALMLYEANDTPISLGCYLQLKYGELRDLVSRKVHPYNYPEHQRDKFFRDNSSVSFLKKVKDKIPGLDPKLKAEESFLETEKQCCMSNVKWSDFISYQNNDGLADEALLPYLPFVKKVRKILGSFLGPLPWELSPAFGPGATFSDKSQKSAIIEKMMSTPTVTKRGWCLADPLWTDRYRQLFNARSDDQLPLFVKGNRFTTVPKTAVTDRPIAVEPSLLMYFQKGIGSAIRSRLRRVGIRLERSERIHKDLLLKNPCLWSTIDLSSASDTISYKFVKAVMPPDWFDLVDTFRSPFTLFKGKWHRLEKFSSMGNGYTFELETILFLSIVVALDETNLKPGSNVFVYGDDIMLPPSYFDAACGALKFCGFSINEDKSFKDGPFKESCGVDVFNGTNVRAYHVKDIPNDPPSFIALCNGLRHLADRYSGDYRCFDLYRRPWLRALDALPGHIRRLRGPAYLGDFVIFDNDARPRLSQSGHETFKGIVPYPRKLLLDQFPPQAVLALALYGATVGPGWVAVRGSPRGFKLRTFGLEN